MVGLLEALTTELLSLEGQTYVSGAELAQPPPLAPSVYSIMSLPGEHALPVFCNPSRRYLQPLPPIYVTVDSSRFQPIPTDSGQSRSRSRFRSRFRRFRFLPASLVPAFLHRPSTNQPHCRPSHPLFRGWQAFLPQQAELPIEDPTDTPPAPCRSMPPMFPTFASTGGCSLVGGGVPLRIQVKTGSIPSVDPTECKK